MEPAGLLVDVWIRPPNKGLLTLSEGQMKVGIIVRAAGRLSAWKIVLEKSNSSYHVLLLQERQDHGRPRAAVRGWWVVRAVGQGAVGRVVVVQCQPDLLEVVAALHAPRRLPRRLHRRQQQGDENANDGDDHKQLDQCKGQFWILDCLNA